MPFGPQGRVRAPELAGGRGWLNTERPLSLAALKGKVVLLDFWTYGCVNCMHNIPDLKRLEAKYGSRLVVIGVHSAKFENEKETENIRRIVLRYEIEHPVVNDADFRIWDAYAVRAWPTQVLIDPAGYVAGIASGEGNYEVIDKAIAQLVTEFGRRGELSDTPLKLALERAKLFDGPLAFPGKVLADAAQNRLFIADSNHNRIVVTELDGTLLEIIGTGERGAQDGPTGRATFYRPQGMALDGDVLYVADTENHLVRQVDLKAHAVKTIAGTGEQSRKLGQEGGAARSVPLNSPWDLQLVGRELYIAMAGPHQIWKLDLDQKRVWPFAGTGAEARRDGLRKEAAFAQPSGLATDGQRLYVADSESNIIRAVDLQNPSGGVRTLAGGDLFEFGDEDGEGDEVRLQHPLGLAAWGGRVFIADTYNHKLKLLEPASGRVRSFLGTGQPGQADGEEASFYEPGGLSVAGDKLYVADTNNHAVRVVDLKTRRTATLMIKGLRPPATETARGEAEANSARGPNAEEIRLAPQPLRAASEGTLCVEVSLPAGYHLNPFAPQRYSIEVEKGGQYLSLAEGTRAALVSKELQLPLRLTLRSRAAGTAALKIQLTLFYCREDNTGTCQIKTLIWRAPVEVVAQPAAPLELKAHSKIVE